MPNIYTYVDYTGFLAEVMESDLNFAGDWRSTANYYRYDVVTYGFARYVCTTANTNQTPPSDLQFNGYWSIITFTSTGTGSSGTNTGGGGASTQMVQDVYSLAYRAYNIALTGTDLPVPGAVDPWVMEWIGHTYNIARTGTVAAAAAQAAANAADMWGRDAFHLAVAGTNAANSADRWGRDAYSLAVSGTNAAAAAQSAADSAWSYAGQAWNIAVAGTNAADQAYSLALQALYAAWDGTNTSGGVPSWVMDWLAQTYNLSVAGTNAANQADTTANHALSIAVAGTTAADQAYSLALQALYTAWTGTDTPTPGPGGGSGTVPSWVMDWLSQTYHLSTTGTNAANQAYSLALQALNAAWAGTNTSSPVDTANLVKKSGDTMTGTLGSPAVYLEHGTKSPSSGTVVVDFTGKAYNTVFLTGDTAFDGTNYGDGNNVKTITYRLFSNGTLRNLRFNPQFIALREVPKTFQAGHVAIASFSCFGTLAADVVYAYAEQAL